MEWDSSLTTGEETIDAQHKMLVGMFAELERAEAEDGPDAVREALDKLTDYTAVHFTMEQDLMSRERFPVDATEEHVHEHRALTERVRQMVLEYRTGQLSTIGPLVTFLGGWLTHHVGEMDRRLADHVRGRA